MPPKPMTVMSSVNQTCAQRPRRRPDLRHQREQRRDGRDPDHADDGERRAPAQLLADEGAQRDPDDVGDREAGEHQRQRPALLARGGDGPGDDRAGAEERAVHEAGEEPGRDERPERRRQRGGHVAHDEQHHEPDQHAPARQRVGQGGQGGRPDDDPEGVRRDQPAGRRDRDAEGRGHLGQQPHGDELGRADAEGADGEGEECEGHGGIFLVERMGRGARRAPSPRRALPSSRPGGPLFQPVRA
jgi:hypothetical protein